MSAYFRNVPNFEYVNRLPESHSSSEFIEVKNLFKEEKLGMISTKMLPILPNTASKEMIDLIMLLSPFMKIQS